MPGFGPSPEDYAQDMREHELEQRAGRAELECVRLRILCREQGGEIRDLEARAERAEEALGAAAALQEISDREWAKIIKERERLGRLLRRHGIDPETL